jgi:hypothetical protein
VRKDCVLALNGCTLNQPIDFAAWRQNTERKQPMRTFIVYDLDTGEPVSVGRQVNAECARITAAARCEPVRSPKHFCAEDITELVEGAPLDEQMR